MIRDQTIVLESADLVPTLRQVNVEQEIFWVYEGGEDPAHHPTLPEADGEGDEAFLNSLDLDHSYLYLHSNDSVWRQIRQLLLSY